MYWVGNLYSYILLASNKTIERIKIVQQMNKMALLVRSTFSEGY